MNRQQWLEWRRGGMGASDAPIVMGVSPFKTVRDLWEDKVNGREDHDNPSMKRGREMEEEARRCFEEMTSTCVFPTRRVHKDMDWLRATLDGIDIDDKIMVEIKCPNKEDHFLAVTKKIPAKYFPQCQHQLLVTGLQGMYYFSYDGSKGVIVEVLRDDAYIDEMLEKEKAFWDKVTNRIPVETPEQDFLDLSENIAWEQHAIAWKKTKKALKDLEEKEKVIRQEMLKTCGERNAQGFGLQIARSICKGNIDYQTAIKDYLQNLEIDYPNVYFPPLELDKYRKESFTKWAIRNID